VLLIYGSHICSMAAAPLKCYYPPTAPGRRAPLENSPPGGARASAAERPVALLADLAQEGLGEGPPARGRE